MSVACNLHYQSLMHFCKNVTIEEAKNEEHFLYFPNVNILRNVKEKQRPIVIFLILHDLNCNIVTLYLLTFQLCPFATSFKIHLRHTIGDFITGRRHKDPQSCVYWLI